MPHIEPNRGYGAGNRFVMVPKRIKIDIKPRNKRNKINPRSRGNIWVAILSDSQFAPLLWSSNKVVHQVIKMETENQGNLIGL